MSTLPGFYATPGAAIPGMFWPGSPAPAIGAPVFTFPALWSVQWAQAETRASRALPLGAGESVELYGRIDRIDTMPGSSDGAALLDYKTQTAKAIRERLQDDVQLPAYALLHGDAAQAAYVALDDENIVAVSAGADPGELTGAAQAQGKRLQESFTAMRAGARLPAHGADSVCKWCEMSGLCRKDYV